MPRGVDMEKYDDYALTPDEKIKQMSKAYKDSLSSVKVDALNKTTELNKEDFCNDVIGQGVNNNLSGGDISPDSSQNIGKSIGDVIDKIGLEKPSENVKSPSSIPVEPVKESNKGIFNLLMMYLILTLARC